MLKPITEFLAEVKRVVREITWPKQETLIQLTVVVILISIIIGTALAVVDFVFTKLIGWLTLR